jgi:hypothetical protein
LTTYLAITPNTFTPVPFSGRAAFPLTLSLSWVIPPPAPEHYWYLGTNAIIPGGYVIASGFEFGPGNFAYTGPSSDIANIDGTVDFSLMGGATRSQNVAYGQYSITSQVTVALDLVTLNAAVVNALAFGGTITASVTLRSIHVLSFTGTVTSSTYYATDLYDVSGVLSGGRLPVHDVAPRVDFGGTDVSPASGYGALTWNATQVQGSDTGYHSNNQLIAVVSARINGAIVTGAYGSIPFGTIYVSPTVATVYTLTITYSNGLVITRTATVNPIARSNFNEMDMAQDHASGHITIIRSVAA